MTPIVTSSVMHEIKPTRKDKPSKGKGKAINKGV
jgi:hypothetical protein